MYVGERASTWNSVHGDHGTILSHRLRQLSGCLTLWTARPAGLQISGISPVSSHLSTGALGLQTHANKSGFTPVLGVELRSPITHSSTLPIEPSSQPFPLFPLVGHGHLSLSPLKCY